MVAFRINSSIGSAVNMESGADNKPQLTDTAAGEPPQQDAANPSAVTLESANDGALGPGGMAEPTETSGGGTASAAMSGSDPTPDGTEPTPGTGIETVHSCGTEPSALDSESTDRGVTESTPGDGSDPAIGDKPGGFELWRGRLRSARLVVAPMVDQSEAAWRMLSRKYGAELCYTPMYHVNMFVKDVKYRRECLTTYPEDRPLIIQFCANNPATLLEAARYCEGGQFDALDINLGCPQSIARRGHYGAFLQDEWELISQLVKVVHEQSRLPVTCKIRIFPELEKTIRYARMLESAGCQLLTVHGRTREMKGPLTGLADWDAIKAVREAVSIPVFANGNIQYLSDVHRCLEHTGVQGVMTAEGNLHNPALFAGLHPPVWEVAEEYLQLARRYPCPLSYARGHVFKILHYCLLMPSNHDVRQLTARASRLEQLEEAVELLRQRYSHLTEPGAVEWRPAPDDPPVLARLPLSPLFCQPHEREPIEDHLKKMQANADKQRREQQEQKERKEQREEEGDDTPARPPARAQDPSALSKRKLKKLARGAKVGANRAIMERCSLCCNPRGLRCEFLLCRLHCRDKCYEHNLDCPGHRILVKTKRQNARDWHDRQRRLKEVEEDGESAGGKEGVGNGMGTSNGEEVGKMEVPNGEKAVEVDSSKRGEVVKMDSSKGGEEVEMDSTNGVGSTGSGETAVNSAAPAAVS
ncbi:tRNA-dihydrouridine(16/17) synthase [NAD(P)(+)]-like isoform X2 [Amphibalanus amphitrite]|uniref:tRNA-dihydrouridine(16/17) synthase [NAD(P)(+)]-like isoform X2 n=1 Tax=Amphibalanus amphitrite TaxID=1232801 RepID=UPI001C92AA5D|nr:tRNA-dihydrouridine(16/17) synthase [NAD(P)(+)]-like isoform X2 [Amphibalanus amphitrite]